MIYVGNKYEIVQEIGRGYRCCLFKSKDMYDGQDVIISLIDEDVDISKTFISNLIDESTVINEIDSPYILNIKDVGIHELENGCKVYYTVSDYIEGNTLEELTRYHNLNLEEIVLIFRQILSGLEVAHNYDIYHGYLRPSNIIIDEGYNVKICNLGIIKSNNRIFNNSINIISQDLRYLSPQQICLGYSDKSSDFFSLGIMLFELVFKKHPFGVEEEKDEMLKNLDKGINWREFDTQEVPYKLIHIINKLVSRCDKYKTPKEVIIDLSEYMYEVEEMEFEYQESVDLDEFVENEYKEVDLLSRNSYHYKKGRVLKLVTMTAIVTLVSIILGIIM